MIGPDIVQALHVAQEKMLAEENVVEGPACKRILRMEGREQAASLTGIEKAADVLEQSIRVGPGHVVEVTGDDGRILRLRDLSGDHDKLGIARCAAMARMGWPWMKPVEGDRFAAGQDHRGA